MEPEPATGAHHGAPLPPLRPPHYLSPSTCQKVEEGFVLGWCHPAYDPLHSRSGHECLTSVCVHCFFCFTTYAKAPNASMNATTQPRAEMQLL